MWDMHDGMGWWMVFSAFWFVLFWAIVIGLVVWGANQLSRGSRGGDGRDSAIDILRERYARGELSKEEFERSRQEIARR